MDLLPLLSLIEDTISLVLLFLLLLICTPLIIQFPTCHMKSFSKFSSPSFVFLLLILLLLLLLSFSSSFSSSSFSSSSSSYLTLLIFIISLEIHFCFFFPTHTDVFLHLSSVLPVNLSPWRSLLLPSQSDTFKERACLCVAW